MTPADQFEKTIVNLLAGRTTLNITLAGQRERLRAREYSLQGLYLLAVRSFETFLEDQIIGLACREVKWASRIHNGTRVRWTNRLHEHRKQIVKTVIMRERTYVDYLPYERTVDVANVLFHGGRPFTLLPQASRISLIRCQRVRNYIAHESEFSYEKFIASYELIKPLRVANPKALHYLDDQIRAGVTFFEHDLAELVSISQFLS